MNTPTADEDVVGLVDRDHALGDRIRNGLGDAMLRRAEHLHGLLGALDRHLVEQDRVGLAQQVRRDDREQRREAVLVVDERVGEGELGRRAARTHDQVDMRDFVAVADQRLADQHLVDQSHVFLPEFLAPDSQAPTASRTRGARR